MAALATTLETTGATIWRSTDLERDIPAEGMISLVEGGYTPEPILSPLSYIHDMPVMTIASIVAGTEPERDAAMDALLQGISSALLADRTLAGAVETLLIGEAPEFDAFEADGAAKSAQFTITLSFTTAGSALA